MKKVTDHNFLTTKEFWVETQGQADIIVDSHDFLYNWIKDQINIVNGQCVFEIGCYPGRYLYPFAEKGYTVSGIDYLEHTDSIARFYQENGFKVGKFYQSDFFETQINDRFDVVTSFGFIEHFKNYEEVIRRQANLVKQNGYIIIEVPNFLGLLQLLPRYLFDYKNFKRHNLEAMNPDKWESILKSEGFEIIEKKYIGGFRTWYETKHKSKLNLFLRNTFEKVLYQIKKRMKKVDSRLFSAFIVLIAKKVQ